MPPVKHIDLEDLVVRPDANLLDTLRVIDRGALEVALVCDAAGRLCGVCTDGDIRRVLIAGGSLEVTVDAVANREPITLGPDADRSDALRLMLDRRIKCVPVVDEQGFLVDIHSLHTSLRVTRSESWAVVMAGGFGTRLGELTKGIPKPMLPIGDRPILQHIVEHLVGHGITRVFLSVSYLGAMVEDHFGDGSRFDCRIDYLREDEPLGTGGPLALLPEAPRAPLVVMNGDLLTRINITRLLAFHRAGEFDATMALREHEVKVPFGVAEVADSKVERLVEKPSLHYRINAGIYAIEPELVARVQRRFFPITELLNGCLERGGKIGAYHMQEPWQDIGLPDEFDKAQQSG